jgi:hypothetical protein
MAEIATPKKSRTALKILAIVTVVIVAGLGITLAIFGYHYSEGNRVGIVVKFSKKGFVFKTYEGELNMGGVNPMPGNTIANNIWVFSVPKEDVAQKLMKLEGQKVSLHYNEVIKPMPWQGDTKYFVDGVEIIK